MQNKRNIAELESVIFLTMHKSIYRHTDLWLEIDFIPVYWEEYYGTGIGGYKIMKRCLKIVLSLALALVLAGSLSVAAQAHSGHHARRAKGIRMTAYTTSRNQASGTTDNTASGNDAADTAEAAPAVPEAPAQAPDAAPVYASCYENGYCTGNNSCDVNGVCQYGGICDGAPCYQETCPWDGGCVVDGVCQYGGNCYGLANQNAGNGGNYGHHGGGHHGGHHR